MKLTGFLLLLSGWIIVVTAIALLPTGPSQAAFVVVALGIEALGLTLVFRAHSLPLRERR